MADVVVPIDIAAARGFWGRFKGLMFAAAQPQGLLLARCTSVHTCFMRHALDIVYLDEQGCVTKLVERLQPWHASFGDRRAVHVLELGAGSIRALRLRLGDRLVHAVFGTAP